mgnify:CR=1 FL=1
MTDTPDDEPLAPPEAPQGVSPIAIEDELKKSYLDYAMSVIVARALPDARDGLKPVHRRILWGAWEKGNTHDKKYVKSAKIVGDVMGAYQMQQQAQQNAYNQKMAGRNAIIGGLAGLGGAWLGRG